MIYGLSDTYIQFYGFHQVASRWLTLLLWWLLGVWPASLAIGTSMLWVPFPEAAGAYVLKLAEGSSTCPPVEMAADVLRRAVWKAVAHLMQCRSDNKVVWWECWLCLGPFQHSEHTFLE